MADTTKPVEVAQVAPAAEPVVETKPTETAAAATTEATPETAPAVEATPAAATETAAVAETPAAEAVAEEAKEEVKPVEEGHLEHKGQGANFPKNFIYSKTLFWFGSEPVDVKATSSFKADKVADVAHHVTAWAAETGKGLLFYSEKGDKAAPHGAIQLAEASEPVTEGTNKFHFTAKGHKHAFKAPTVADRDNWVAQLKAKIAEAKELATTITESEKYKTTLESLKPAPVKKEEKAAEAVAEAPATTEETPAAAEVPAVAAVETEAEATKEEVKEEEKKTEEAKKEEPKRRSASRKRASIFGSFLGKKEEKKTAETPEVNAEAETPATDATPAIAAETAVVEAPAVEATPEVAPVATETAVTEAKPEEKSEEKKEEVAEAVRPSVPAKRSSIFGNLSFGKKKAAPAAEIPAKETPATEAVAETAPVIPAVETTEPLSTEVSSPATVPTETVEVTPAAAATNGETKKEVKSDKRKSSLPFAFGKKKEGTTSDEEGEKPKSPSAFSKLRATIKGKGKTEKVEKSEETPAVPALPAAEETPASATEEAKPAETTEVAAVAPAAEAEEDKTAKPLEATPVVTATA